MRPLISTSAAPVTTTPAAAAATPSDTVRRAEVEELVRANLALVGHLVREMLGRVPGHVSRDDLTSAGLFALVQAAEGFDVSRGVGFGTYASTRIRGALVDELRGLDWASRSVRRRARQVDEARGRLSTVLGRPAEDAEVAAALGIGTGELVAHREDLARASVVSLQGFEDSSVEELLPTGGPTPLELVEQREQVAYLHDAIAQLPERLRVVVEGYFFHDRPMAELAVELGVTESRISQLRAEAVALLRGALVSALEPGLVEAAERPGGCASRRKEAYYASVASHRSFAARLSSPHPGTYSA